MSFLTFGFKWGLRVIIPVALLGGILFFLGKGIQDTSVERFDITGISDLSVNSFTINGNLYVHNPSDLPIPIKVITYDVILEETDKVIGSGELSSFTLEAESTTQIPFAQQINWVPTAELAADLLLKEEVLIDVVGEVFIDLPKVDEYAIPFSAQTDIKAYISQFASLPAVQDALPQNTQNVVDGVTNPRTEGSGDDEQAPGLDLPLLS